jgi:hypothetical protein
VTGIEPVSHAWEAHILPLNYTRRTFSNPTFARQPNLGKANSSFDRMRNYFTYARKKDLLEAGSDGFILPESAGIA